MADAATSTTVLVALGAALVTLVLVLPRRGGRDEREAIELVSEMNRRMERTVRELSEALERAQEEGRRNRFLGQLGGSIDLDEVLEHTLQAGGAIPGVDAALVSIQVPGEKPIVATLGLSAGEAQRQVISGPPDSHE